MRWLLTSGILSGLIHSRRRRVISGKEWERRVIVFNSVLAFKETSVEFLKRVVRGNGSSSSGTSTQVTLGTEGVGLAVFKAGGNTLLGKEVVTSLLDDEDAAITRRARQKPDVR